jgi:5-methylcytosine-specific restriction endonuclease McrA
VRNKTEYPENWNDEIRPAVLKRDNFRCTKCGLVHRKTYVFFPDGHKMVIPKSEIDFWKGDGNTVKTIYLQVAHLDHLKTNHNLTNLAAMCVKCHLNYDRATNNILRIAKKTKI